MAKRLDGKVAVVTGGGRGIGRSVCLDLAAEGASVVVNDLGAEHAANVVAEIKKSGGKAVALASDIATMNGGENAIKAAIDNFRRVDILVCCAGICVMKAVEETTEEDWDKTMAIHLKGHFSCIHAAVPYMKKQKSGTIVTVSSRGAMGVGPSFTAYTVAKAGLLGLTISLALELGKYGITVNSILPSAITQLFPWDKKPLGDGVPAAIPSGPEMVSPFVTYLATDEARNINGQYWYVGGGDIALYTQIKPLALLHKTGRWTVDEIIETLPKTIGVNLVNPAPRA